MRRILGEEPFVWDEDEPEPDKTLLDRTVLLTRHGAQAYAKLTSYAVSARGGISWNAIARDRDNREIRHVATQREAQSTVLDGTRTLYSPRTSTRLRRSATTFSSLLSWRLQRTRPRL